MTDRPDVRLAGDDDLPLLQGIEAAADRMFEPLMDISEWGAPPTGAERARSGRVLVIGEPAVGFAHVVEIDGRFHLQQLAVHPDHTRQGLGLELGYAAVDLAASRGGDSISLTTYAEVPWNAPFYRRLGFAEIDPPPAYLAGVLADERAAGLAQGGRRIAMMRPISEIVIPRPAVSVIPVRDGADGLEVFVQHRVSTMDFAPGAVVFPGGRIDPQDEANAPDLSPDVVDDLVEVWEDSAYVREAVDPRLAVRIIHATGLREMHEETGVVLDPGELIPWDDWTTPPNFPKRFQVHFLVAHLPIDDPRSPRNTTTEALVSEWLPVDDLLHQGRSETLQVMTPTRVILQELADLATVDAVLRAHPQITAVHLDRSGARPRPSRR